jgi:ribonucleotide reductase alpha subunit
MKVVQRQMLNDTSSNNSSSNFNSVADQALMVIHHEKLLVDILLPEDNEKDAFLNEVHKKKVSNEIRQRNREKKLSKASSNQEQESDTGLTVENRVSDLEGIIPEVSNSVTEISAGSSY